MSDLTQEYNSISALPVEIQVLIFQALPDVQTLRALILTNSYLHQVFLKFTASISFAVLSNEVPYTVLPEAIAAWSSSQIQPWSKSRVRKFLEDYHTNRDAQVCQSWTLSKAREVSRLYQCCRQLASAFISSNSAYPPSSRVTSFRKNTPSI